MRWALGVVLLAGCDAVFLGGEHETCAGQAGPNNTGLFQFCAETIPMATRSLTTQLSTDDDCDSIVMDDREELCVISAVKISIGASVRALGTRPLVLFATESIVVGGALSVTSRNNEGRGAGANGRSCTAIAPPEIPNAQTDGGGGGAGGSFELEGAAGGTGAGTSLGSMPRPGVPLGTIRGGCSGGIGSIGGTAMAMPGQPGAGGGAMYLVAGESITISGTLEASGAGGDGGGGFGSGGTGGAGGSGGGSGGLIALDAPRVTLEATARVVANGGSGGGGASSTAGAVGKRGETADAAGTFPFSTLGGSGGGIGNGGGGGPGGDAANPAMRGNVGIQGTGGGGGGGAVGVIRVFSTNVVTDTTLISPPY